MGGLQFQVSNVPGTRDHPVAGGKTAAAFDPRGAFHRVPSKVSSLKIHENPP